MFRPRLRIPRLPRAGVVRPAPARLLHLVPPLPPEIKANEGIPGFLSPEGLDIAYSQYMTLIIDKLNRLVAETKYATKATKDIVLMTAREPLEAPTFNHASMAHNTEFFFRHLSPTPTEMPEVLRRALEQSFGSTSTLQREFVATAMAMFGPGFVWLVKVARPGAPDSFRLLPTYLAGSPYKGAHWRRQGVDMNSVGGESPEGRAAALEYLGAAGHGAATGRGPPAPPPPPGSHAEKDRTAPGGIDVLPVLCLNTWEHTWLRDYGVGAHGGGKRAFVERWWDRINWKTVAEAANLKRPAFMH